MVDEGSAAAEAAALRRKRVLERGKDRLKSITVGGRKEEDLQQQPAAAATTAIESKEAATATTTTATTEAAPLPPPPLPTTTTTTTAARGAAAVLDRARTEITPSPRGASRSRNGGATAGGRGASAATTAAAAAEQTTQLLFARRAAAATAEDVALAALRASSPSRLLLAAAAPMLLPTLSKFLGGFAGEDSGGSFQLLLSPLVTALASLCASRPLLLLLTLQAWLVATASALLVSRPSALGASLEDSPTPAGALRSLAKLAGLARGEEAARRLRWVAVAADAAGAARDACAVYLVSAVTVAYYHSFKLAREMDALAAAAAAAEGSSAVEVRGKKKM